MEVTEGLLFGHKRILTLFGRGGSVQGFGQPILVGHHPESEDPVLSGTSTLRIHIVGVFVGPVGVLVEVLVIQLNAINLVSNFKTHENNDFYLDWTTNGHDPCIWDK